MLPRATRAGTWSCPARALASRTAKSGRRTRDREPQARQVSPEGLDQLRPRRAPRRTRQSTPDRPPARRGLVGVRHGLLSTRPGPEAPPRRPYPASSSPAPHQISYHETWTLARRRPEQLRAVSGAHAVPRRWHRSPGRARRRPRRCSGPPCLRVEYRCRAALALRLTSSATLWGTATSSNKNRLDLLRRHCATSQTETDER